MKLGESDTYPSNLSFFPSGALSGFSRREGRFLHHEGSSAGGRAAARSPMPGLGSNTRRWYPTEI